MAFSDPQAILDQFGLHEGMKVADLGSGSGFYALAAAKRVSPGSVYAVEVQEDLLTRLRTEMSKNNVGNIELIHGDMETPGGTKIADGAVDAALSCNVLFQVENKDSFVDEIKRILKPDGRVLVVDWADSFGGMGPQQGSVITIDSTREIFKRHGFVEITTFAAGDHHYGISFRRS